MVPQRQSPLVVDPGAGDKQPSPHHKAVKDVEHTHYHHEGEDSVPEAVHVKPFTGKSQQWNGEETEGEVQKHRAQLGVEALHTVQHTHPDCYDGENTIGDDGLLDRR